MSKNKFRICTECRNKQEESDIFHYNGEERCNSCGAINSFIKCYTKTIILK